MLASHLLIYLSNRSNIRPSKCIQQHFNNSRCVRIHDSAHRDSDYLVLITALLIMRCFAGKWKGGIREKEWKKARGSPWTLDYCGFIPFAFFRSYISLSWSFRDETGAPRWVLIIGISILVRFQYLRLEAIFNLLSMCNLLYISKM